jgi:sterol desaturase/sphingolipid hydroxylase (fatty acid hydroxylase superfamily)
MKRPVLDLWLEHAFGDADPGGFGTGWMSGVCSVLLGLVGALGVLVLWFPEWLSTERFRLLYPLPLLRGILQVVIALAFLLGTLSLLLRRRKVLGLTGIGLALAAVLLGGGTVPIHGVSARPVQLGLDWFLLNLLLLTLLFVPVERLFPRRPEQRAFRPGWTTDGMHFLVSHVFVQATTFLILFPATSLARLWQPAVLQTAIRAQPLVFQFLETVLIADLAQYAVHRTFHRVPALWRFHAVHHSSRDLDWIAGSRLHLVDVVATRSLVFLPLFLLGFREGALNAYLVFVSFHAVFIHANLRFPLRGLEPFVVTPRFHHWHHAASEAARDCNFAVHLPWIDRLFGTTHLPQEAWPAEYGIQGDPVPEGYLAQLVYPLRAGRPR